MTDVDRLLRELAGVARTKTAPAISVRTRVLQTIHAQPQSAPLDLVPAAFAGVAVAVAFAVLIALLPAWQAMFEPWVDYFPY